jgi:hypothetical protein
MIASIAERIAAEEDSPLAMVDQAIDMMIRSVGVIDKYLPLVDAESVPQQAALDGVAELMEQAISPYLADIAKAMTVFGE